MLTDNKGVKSRVERLASSYHLLNGSLILITVNSKQNKGGFLSERLSLTRVGFREVSKKDIERINLFREQGIILSQKLGFSDELTMHLNYGFFTVPRKSYWSNYKPYQKSTADFIDCTFWIPDEIFLQDFFEHIRLDFDNIWEIIDHKNLKVDLEKSKNKFITDKTIIY